MADYIAQDTDFTLVANAIRAKTGDSGLLEWPIGFKTAIDNIVDTDCIKTVGPAPVVSVTDAAPLDAEDVVVSIEPVQSGSGDPSPDNVRPITGWDGVEVTKTGKNLLDETYRTNTGNNVRFNMLAYYHTFLKGGMAYTISASSSPNQIQIYDETNTRIANKYVSPLTFTPDRDVYVHIDIYYATVPIDGLSAVQVQLEPGSTATNYEPYQGNTYDITFPSEAGTVYGGTLDVVNGELVVDKAFITFDGSNDEAWYINSGAYWIAVSGKQVGFKTSISNEFKNVDWAWVSSEYGVYGDHNTLNRVYFKPPYNGFTETVEEWRTWLASNPLQLCYELATPITYQLTPQQIALLRGNNTLWADTGDATLKYFTTAFEDLAEEIGFADGGDY